MIQIDSLRMHLPQGFEHRATTISRMVGNLLANQSTQHSAQLDTMRITLPPLRPHMPDMEIAQLIVGQINHNIVGGH